MSNTETTNYKKVLNHFGATITDTMSKDCDFFIYEDSTVDGYSVFIATETPSNISISNHVYYYDNDLSIAFVDALTQSNHKKIYIEDTSSYWLEEAIQELNDMIDEEELEEEANWRNDLIENINTGTIGPDWFEGDIYEEGGEVTNPTTGVTVELNNVQLSIYDSIIGTQFVLEIEPNTLNDNNLKHYFKSLIWFKENCELSETLINK